MLHTTCPRTAAALVVVHRRSRFARQFGRFAQRTIDRRFCGILAAAFIAGPASVWFPAAVRAAGGRPSPHCWQPFAVPPAPAIACAACGATAASASLGECECLWAMYRQQQHGHA